jgi:ribose transport system permease protein
LAEKKVLKKENIRDIFPFMGLAVVLLVFGILTKGRLFSSQSIKAITNDGIYILLGTIGYLFLFAQGNLDFSIGYNMGVSCAVGCIAANTIGMWAAFPAALITGTVIGLINGTITVKLRMASLVSTMAMMFILQGLVLVILNGSVLAAPLAMLKWFNTPLKIAVIAIFTIAGFLLFEYTKFGKISKAIGACPEAVRQTGINTDVYKIAAFVLMGLIAGMLGFISLVRTGSATNQTGSTLMFNVLNAALLGGLPMSGGPTAKFRGAILGTLTMSFMVSGMTTLGISATNQQFIKGIVFLVAIGISFDRRNLKVIK